jgi:uncharacterized membrane protein/mono/diheme cytochrome c family protein
MQRWKNIFFNIVLSLNCLLLVLVLAGDNIKVPAWLQVAGRMHPLLLHFPIVLLVLYILWSMVLQAKSTTVLTGPEDEIGRWLLLGSALTAVITALMGILLSRETGYNAEALWWHKWGGVAIALFSFLWYAYRNTIHRQKYIPQLAAVISMVLIVITGHQGANITHGENYLLAPVTPENLQPVVALEDAEVFKDMVMPILDGKCMSCHSSKKAKGELIMETAELLLKGGKHGALWTAGQPEQSLLMQRIHLPDTEKKHMPPVGKPQLDDEEASILFQWIRSGANFTQKVAALPVTDSLRVLAANLFGRSSEEAYDFSAASDKDVEKLNNTNRLIHPIALGSPALAVNFYNRQNYTNASLKEIQSLKMQVVQLDLAYMPVTAEDISTITQFSNLRKLNLNFSTVPGSSLVALGKLPLLKHLSLAGVNLSAKDIASLTAIPKLNSVYLWNVPVAAEEIANLKKRYTKINFETGFSNDTLLLKLNPPVLETEERIVNGAPLALRLKHYIRGVTIRYTTDGTNPDSIHSAVYKDSVMLNQKGVFKARAFKAGWLGSDSIAATFFKNTYRADSIRAVTPLDSVYKGSAGARTLVNGEKGDFNFRNGQWLGFRRNKMEVVMHYRQPVTVSSVTLSTLVDMGGFIMPPAMVEVWGGDTEQGLKRLAHINPQQPDSLRAAYMWGLDCNFTPTPVKILKLIAVPVAKLPAWHPGKGQKAWLFTDEIFVN